MRNERLSNKLDDQSFPNIKYDQSKTTEDILLDNLCDAHLRSLRPVLKEINAWCIKPENVYIFLDEQPS